MRNLDTLTGIVQTIVFDNFKYVLPRRGQVVNLIDPAEKGRILVVIPDFNWDTADKGVWCRPIETNSLKTPAVDDWVIVMWINGNPDDAIYLGQDTQMKDMVPVKYQPNTQVLFEDIDNKVSVVYNEKEDEMLIGKDDFRESARKEDTTISSSAEDSGFWAFFIAFFGVVTGVPIPEPGNGAPSALQAAMALAITGAGGTPSNQAGKIDSGSSQIKVGDK